MRKTICKIIVVIFLILLLSMVFALSMLMSQEITLYLLATMGVFTISWLVVTFVELLFKDKKNK